MALSEIVSVNITTQTQQVTQAGFTTLMILGVHKAFTDLIRYYSSLSEVAADFTPNMPEYIAAQDVFSQVLSPELIAIGRRATANAVISVIGAQAGQNYTTTINGVNCTVPSTTTVYNSEVTLSTALVSGNVTNCKINGIDISPVTYATSANATMLAIAAAIVAADTAHVLSATVGGAGGLTITVIGQTNQPAVLSDFDITVGSVPTATITTTLAPTTNFTIAASMVAAIIAASIPNISAVDNLDGSYQVTTSTPTVAYTLNVSTNIINPLNALIEITQIIPGAQYFVTVNGTQLTYVAPFDVQTNEQIAAGLVAVINAGSQPVSATDNLDGTFYLSSTNSSTFILSIQASSMAAIYGLLIQPYTASQAIGLDLTAIYNSSSNWYAFIYTERTSADVLAAAAWAQAQTVIFGTASEDTNIINETLADDTTSIAYLIFAAGYTRTFCMYHQDANHDYPEVAWMARVLPLDPGSETWKFKNLASISASNLTTTQSGNAFAKNCNTYQFIGGVAITRNGTVGSGEWIDTIRGIDWLTATIQEFVYSLLVNNNKVPYTDTGAAMVQSEVSRALTFGVNRNFLSNNPAPVVTVPLVATVSNVDKAARLLPSVNFTATLAGAIQAVTINGNVSL